MGLVKTRRLAAMQKQQRAKARLKPAAKCGKVYPKPKHEIRAGSVPTRGGGLTGNDSLGL